MTGIYQFLTEKRIGYAVMTGHKRFPRQSVFLRLSHQTPCAQEGPRVDQML